MTDQMISEDELHAYVDGELPADRRGAVEAWLAAHADDAARVAAWRAQAEIIRKRYGGIASEVPPKRLQVERLTRSRRSWMAAAISPARSTTSPRTSARRCFSSCLRG